jgi:hypothetical protein
MVRGWILFSCLALSVIFRLYRPYTGEVKFPFSDRILNTETWVYYTMEHLIAIGVAACLFIRDSTPKQLIWLYFAILCLDFLHYLLFFRDETPGFNIFKVVLFGLPLLWIQLKHLWNT